MSDHKKIDTILGPLRKSFPFTLKTSYAKFGASEFKGRIPSSRQYMQFVQQYMCAARIIRAYNLSPKIVLTLEKCCTIGFGIH